MICVLMAFLVLQDLHEEMGGIINESGVQGGLDEIKNVTQQLIV